MPYRILFLLFFISFPSNVFSQLLGNLVVSEEQKLYVQSGQIDGPLDFKLNGQDTTFQFMNGRTRLNLSPTRKGELLFIQPIDQQTQMYHLSKNENNSIRIKKIPFWFSILPPLLAILLALVFKEVMLSLFVGIWAGAFIVGGMRLDSFYYFLKSLFNVVEHYIILSLNSPAHLSIILFTLLIGGMVTLISRSGGMAGAVLYLSRYAKSARSSQFITWVLGIAIFFDDYTNTLIVGNTMRSITDRFKISREKLAYIVDSTAAPVASIAFITTWIGAELGYIESGFQQIGTVPFNSSPYTIFLGSLKYSYYPVLTLIFILLIIYTGKDYGPMHRAELKTLQAPLNIQSQNKSANEAFEPVDGAPMKPINAILPILALIGMTVFGLIDTGMAGIGQQIHQLSPNLSFHSWSDVWSNMHVLGHENKGLFYKIGLLIGQADSYKALIWASMTGVCFSLCLTLGQRILNITDSVAAILAGFKTMFPGLMILVLAWALAGTTDDLNTSVFISSNLKDSINPFLLPAVVFLLAAFISFSTGSSWSTMAILYPIAIPTCWAICESAGLDVSISLELMLNIISITLGASVLGDHCSPISDTTILSSISCSCDHLSHVRTQMPYALTVGAISIILSVVSTLLGGGWLICFGLLIIGSFTLAGVVFIFGKQTVV